MNPVVVQICSELGVEIIGRHVRRGPGQTCAVATMESILRQHGEEHLRYVLLTIMESENNRFELMEPVLWAISDVIIAHREWAETGSQWMEAFDAISLTDLRLIAQANVAAAQQRQGIATLLFERLLPIFGPRQSRLPGV